MGMHTLTASAMGTAGSGPCHTQGFHAPRGGGGGVSARGRRAVIGAVAVVITALVLFLWSSAGPPSSSPPRTPPRNFHGGGDLAYEAAADDEDRGPARPFNASTVVVAAGAYPPVLLQAALSRGAGGGTTIAPPRRRWCSSSSPPPGDGNGTDDACRRIARPVAAFEMHRQSEYAPEILILAKRRVSRLFVLPPAPPLIPSPTADAATAWREKNNRRAAETVAFALWLLTVVDPDGAVVLTARSDEHYSALVRGLEQADGAGYSTSAFGNVFISPATFVPPTAEHSQQRQRERETLLWHLAGIDAAEERFEPERIVLLDPVPVVVVLGSSMTKMNLPRQRFDLEQASKRCSPPDAEVGVNVSVVTGVEAADGRALLSQLRRTDWRFWFVGGGGDDSATAAPSTQQQQQHQPRWALALLPGGAVTNANATAVPRLPSTIDELLKARLPAAQEGDAAAEVPTALLPYRLDRALKACQVRQHRSLRPAEAAVRHRRNRFIGQRRYDGVVVQVAGNDDVITIDNALAVLVRNPSWLVVVVAPSRTAEVKAWFKRTPAHLRANLRLYTTATEATSQPRPPCAGLQDQSPEFIDVAAEAACLGAMLSRVVAPMGGGVAGASPVAKNHVVDAPVAVLMPVRHAVVFGGNLTQAFAPIGSNQRARAVAIPAVHRAAVIAVNIDRAFSWSTEELTRHEHGHADPTSLEKLGARLVNDASSIGETLSTTANDTSQLARGLIFDIRTRGVRSPTASAFPARAERPGSPWPASDIYGVLSAAAANDGAVIAHPVEVTLGIGNGPWRYQIRRMRLDPVTVMAMDPLYKASLWCDPDTLEGCPAAMVAGFRKTDSCKRRNEPMPDWLPIACSGSQSAPGDTHNGSSIDAADPRVRPEDRRPPPVLASKTPRSVAVASRGDEVERFDPGGPMTTTTTTTKVDVLLSVISRGDEDMVDMAESWLEYCPTCVIAVECGHAGEPGQAYDTLRSGLAPEVFARVIVNPKRGIHEESLNSVIPRHMANLKFALCFVNPLRVMMVASNEGVVRRGMAEYLLSRSSAQVLDHYSAVAEADEERPAWVDGWTLGVSPRVTQAAQSLVYGNTVAPLPWKTPSLHFCTGKALHDQVKTGMTSAVGFEGTWFTGAQFARFDAAFRLGFWLDPVVYKEHLLLHPTLLQEELQRLYPPPTATTAMMPETTTATTKPPGRNTCFLAKLRVGGPLTLEEVKRAVDPATGAQPFQFSIKRIGWQPWDPARVFLRQRRKAALGISDARPPPPAPTRTHDPEPTPAAPAPPTLDSDGGEPAGPPTASHRRRQRRDADDDGDRDAAAWRNDDLVKPKRRDKKASRIEEAARAALAIGDHDDHDRRP